MEVVLGQRCADAYRRLGLVDPHGAHVAGITGVPSICHCLGGGGDG